MWFLFTPFIMFEMLITGIILAVIMAIFSVAARAFVRGPPKSLIGLRASMITTSVSVILGGLGLLYIVTYYLGRASMGLIYGVTALVAVIMVLQWLFAPSIINAVYRTREPSYSEAWVVETVRELARMAGLKETPKVRIADIDAPNAFAYSSPLKGSYVAVTRGMLELMPREEVKAVLGHEIGHLKHRDIAAIIAISLVPVAMFYLGRTLLMWGWFMSSGEDERGGLMYNLAIGAILVAAGALFQFLVSHFNRLREYYADAFSGAITGEPRLLQRALARLALTYKENPELSASVNKSMAMLFFVNFLIEATGGMAYDPYDDYDYYSYRAWTPWWRRKPKKIVIEDIDRVVEEMMKEETSAVQEIFSSHPPIPKRLRFLENLRAKLAEASKQVEKPF